MTLLLFLQVSLLSLAGWAVTEKLKIPAAGFLGPLLFVGATSIFGLPQPVYPPASIIVLQAVFGAFLGCQADRDSVLRIRSMGLPVAIITVWTVVSSFLFAFVLAHTTGVDVKTSFLATVPGGVAEMSAMSIALGGHTAIVAAMQTLRVIGTMGVIPLLTKRLLGTQAQDPQVPLASVAPIAAAVDARSGPAAWLASLVMGLAGGILFVQFQVPAGGILGAMAVVAVARVAGLGLARPPAWLRIVAMCGMGSYVGTTFSDQTLIQLRDIAIPAIVLTAATVVGSVALARLVQLRTGMDYACALLACAPAGVTQMAIIADEIGADALMVTIFQLTRLMSCVFLMPLLFAPFL